MIERTFDALRIKVLACDSSIFPDVSDDYFSDPQTWEPVISSLVVNLIAHDHQGDFGFGIFIPKTYACFDAHLGFLPRSYGPLAIASFKEMLDWMWRRSTAARIVGEICQENRKAIRFAVEAGFAAYGVNEKSSLRGGVLRDQVCLGISRP